MISVLSVEEKRVGHLPIISALYCNNLKNRTSNVKNAQKQIGMQHSGLEKAFVVVRFFCGGELNVFITVVFSLLSFMILLLGVESYLVLGTFRFPGFRIVFQAFRVALLSLMLFPPLTKLQPVYYPLAGRTKY